MTCQSERLFFFFYFWFSFLTHIGIFLLLFYLHINLNWEWWSRCWRVEKLLPSTVGQNDDKEEEQQKSDGRQDSDQNFDLRSSIGLFHWNSVHLFLSPDFIWHYITDLYGLKTKNWTLMNIKRLFLNQMLRNDCAIWELKWLSLNYLSLLKV